MVTKLYKKKRLLLTCVLEVSIVGIGLAFGSERETYNAQNREKGI